MIPDGWKRRRIQDFGTRSKIINVDGAALPPLSITKGRGVVLQSDKYNKQIATDLRKYVIARRDQFAFDPMSLYYGAIGQVTLEIGLVSPDYVVFDVDRSVDKRLMNYLLRRPEQITLYESVAETGNSFGKRRRVYWSVFADLEFTLPPLEEQRKIAAILSAVDDAIEVTQAVIDQLQVVKKAMMAELLTRGLPGRHTRFKQTEIGEVPEAWEVVELGSLLEAIDSGWSPQCEGRPASAEEWGVLKVSAVTSGVYRDNEHKALPVSLAPRPAAEVQAGDVLLARANGVLELVGKTVLVSSTRPRLMLSDKLLRLKPIQSRLHGPFLCLAMATETVRSRLLSTTGGSDMRNVSQSNLRALLFPLPCLEEQVKISGVLDAVDGQTASERAMLDELLGLRSALMSVLLTGELRVTPDEATP